MRNHTEKGRPRGDTALITMRRLTTENARLNELCEQHKAIAERYELMLREGDHRIKNSLQVVASLLGMQARRASDDTTRHVLHAAAARVQTVARIHDALQLNNGSNDVVDLGALIEKMCASLQEMAGGSSAVQIIVHAAAIKAPLKLAQPIVFAVNELVINALRHAFPHERSGSITITVSESDGQLEIQVTDDGDGLPDNYSAGHGYGMRLVEAMIAKVGGSVDAQNAGGACFTLTAPVYRAAATSPRSSGLLCTFGQQ